MTTSCAPRTAGSCSRKLKRMVGAVTTKASSTSKSWKAAPGRTGTCAVLGIGPEGAYVHRVGLHLRHRRLHQAGDPRAPGVLPADQRDEHLVPLLDRVVRSHAGLHRHRRRHVAQDVGPAAAGDDPDVVEGQPIRVATGVHLGVNALHHAHGQDAVRGEAGVPGLALQSSDRRHQVTLALMMLSEEL